MESQSLAIGDGVLTVLGVAAVNVEVLTGICVDPMLRDMTCMSKKVTSFVDQVAVNLMVVWYLFRLSRNSCSAGSPWVHMVNMSSVYLHHTRGCLSWFERKFCSSLPMNRLANDGAICVPMAVPCCCK